MTNNLDHTAPSMDSVYPPTKFDANVFIGDRDVAKKQNPKWQQGFTTNDILRQ